RRHRADASRWQPCVEHRRRRSAPGEAGTGRLHPGGRGGARSRRPRTAQDPLQVAGRRAAIRQGAGQQRARHRDTFTRLNGDSTRMNIKRTLAIALAIAAAAPTIASAHKAWLRPSQTVVAGEAPWITVDAAVSNDLFYFNHVPLRLDNLVITAPDGTALEAANS